MEELGRIRRAALSEGIDWERRGKEVLLTPEGMERASAAIREEKTAQAARSDGGGVSEDGRGGDRGETGQGATVAAEYAELVIYRLCPNPTWVKCVAPNGSKVECRVQDNRTLHVLQHLRKCVRNPDGRYVFTGRTF